MTKAIPTERMDVETFERWLDTDAPEGRFELADGRVVAMAAERVAYDRLKRAAANVLERDAAGLDFEVFADGMAVRIDAHTQREPDAALRCGPRLHDDVIFYDDPVVIVEVTSTATVDAVDKLAEY